MVKTVRVSFSITIPDGVAAEKLSVTAPRKPQSARKLLPLD